MRRAIIATLVLSYLSACAIYFGDDDAGDDQCVVAEPAPLQLVDPSTLACQDFGGWTCDPSCGPCPELLVPAIPSWGSCSSPCRALGETDCLAAAGCRGAYDYACWANDSICTALTPFDGCFPTDTTGPIQGDCAGLDAWTCSQHDDCIALHDRDLVFVECAAEVR